MSTPIDEPVLVDASAIVTLADRHLPDYDGCLAVSEMLPLDKTFISWPVVTEAAYLLRNKRHHRAKLLEGVENGSLELLQLTSDDIAAVEAVIDKYDDEEVDLADAAIVHLANREEIRAIFTLDRRHAVSAVAG